MNIAASFGLYLHIPFCARKCGYCDFYSLANRPDLIPDYLDALARQMKQMAAISWCRHRRPQTIFFGGGTPSLIAPDGLAFLLDHCQTLFDPVPDAEITIEVNPGTVDRAGLTRLRRAGFNRISIGVQSLDDRLLARLGRIHSAAEAVATVVYAREAGFTNLGLDLMLGLPGQSPDDWQHTLERALDLEPDHLSIYELTLEEGTPFFRMARAGALDLPDEEEVVAMMERARNLTRDAGLERYEISNYARPGRECLHNLTYWHNRSYIGLGAAAVSCLSGRRLTTVADAETFCARIQQDKPVWTEDERLDRETRFRETVIMGLRMITGVCRSGLKKRFGIDPVDYYPELDNLIRQGLLVVEPDRLRLSDRGLLLANQVMARLV